MVDSPKTGSNELGEAVRHARERLGMSRRDLAESTGLSYPYISQIETGYRMPSTPAMRSLADALGLRPDSLFEAIAPMPGRDAAAGRAASPRPEPPTPEPSMPVASVRSAPDPSAPGSAAPLTNGSTPAAPGYAARGHVPPAGGAPAHSRAVGAPVNPSPAGDQTDLVAGAGGNWITNRSFRPIGSRAAPPPNTTADHDRAIELATDLLTSLPTEERLPALAEVQARVVRSMINDAVGRDDVR